MKKKVRIIIILIIVLLLYYIIAKICIDKHDYNYIIKVKHNKYKISEIYENNNYLFTIKDKKNRKFIYRYHQDLNKKKQIITDIIDYQTNNLYCIAPVFKNNIENIVCRANNQIVGYEYLKQNNNSEINKFITKLKQSKYKVNLLWTKENKSVKDKYNLSIYNNIDDSIYITLWNYSRIFIINNKDIKKIDLLNKDCYENNFSFSIGKYYLVVDTDYPYYNNYYLINIEKRKLKKIKIKDEISRKIYFNGTYKDKLYLTDKENSKQYFINLNNETIEETTPKYYNGTDLININIDNLVTKNNYFKKNKKEKTYNKKYNNYIVNNGKVYQIINNNKILLFSFSQFNELKIVDDTLFGIYDDTLYMYNNKVGLKKIIKNRELIYNYKNIYSIYKK